MRKNYILILLFSLLSSVISSCIVYKLVVHQSKKVAVVDAIRLFNEYDMKKELEDQAKVKMQKQGGQIDSIANKIRLAAAEKKEDEKQELLRVYSYLKQQFDNDYKQSNQDINVQVWKRLNPLIEEFGKKKELHLIIGANGMANVLYNDEYFEMTNDVIKFVNNKYEKGS